MQIVSLLGQLPGAVVQCKAAAGCAITLLLVQTSLSSYLMMAAHSALIILNKWRQSQEQMQYDVIPDGIPINRCLNQRSLKHGHLSVGKETLCPVDYQCSNKTFAHVRVAETCFLFLPPSQHWNPLIQSLWPVWKQYFQALWKWTKAPNLLWALTDG